MARVRGLDVSSCQGTIDWSKVPADFRFIVVKASEGAAGRDPFFAANVAGAAATNRLVMAYHFFYTSTDAKRQAENFWAAVGKEVPYRVFIDLETIAKGLSPEEAIDMARIEAEECERFFGRPPGIYTYPAFAKSVLGAALAKATDLARCPLWMADYGKGEQPAETASPVIVAPWDTWALWQTSGNGSSRVPGIGGAVDHDIFNGDELELRRFCGLPDAVDPEPPAIVPPSVDFPDRPAPTEE